MTNTGLSGLTSPRRPILLLVHRQSPQSWWQRYKTPIWIVLGLVCVGSFLYKSSDALREALPIVQTADPGWVMAAVACKIILIGVYASRYRIIFGWLGPAPGWIDLARAHLRRQTLSNVVPLGGPVGLVRFVRDLDRHQAPPSTTLYASFLAAAGNQVGFLLFTTPVLGLMMLSGQASAPLIIGGSIMIAFIVVAGIGAVLLLRSDAVHKGVSGVLPARVTHGLASIREHHITLRDLARTLPHSLGIHLLGTGALLFSLWSVDVHPSLTTVLFARVAASVAVVALPIWQGAGALELTVLGTLVAGGVAAPDALAAIAIFRIAQFWVPLGIGTLAFVPSVRIPSLAPARLRIAAAAGSAASAIAALFLIR
jgi:uncharacterized membrane protein YbhN (UPF0104 family)